MTEATHETKRTALENYITATVNLERALVKYERRGRDDFIWRDVMAARAAVNMMMKKLGEVMGVAEHP